MQKYVLSLNDKFVRLSSLYIVYISKYIIKTIEKI